ncbi:hypothetical protein O181_117044, partial [Austropuccinia psidii MF-1]|nr:hypothetical protein [Austropuccinia psidii MF-1]
MSPSWSYISHNRSLQGTPKGRNPCMPMERKTQQFLRRKNFRFSEWEPGSGTLDSGNTDSEGTETPILGI